MSKILYYYATIAKENKGVSVFGLYCKKKNTHKTMDLKDFIAIDSSKSTSLFATSYYKLSYLYLCIFIIYFSDIGTRHTNIYKFSSLQNNIIL